MRIRVIMPAIIDQAGRPFNLDEADAISRRHRTTRDRAANVRLYRLAAEILAAVEAGVFPPRVGWPCQDCPVRSRCWAWG